MTERQRRVAVISFFALVLIIDWFLYFRHAGHFFQADSIFWLNHRATSLVGYFKGFTQLNPSGFYRPLANGPIESILYPFARLSPVPYRIPLYVLFGAITGAVYALALVLTRRHLVAAIATFFFTIHTVNSYSTYDIGFTPELLYTIFYLGATLAYLRYVQKADRRAYVVSVVCFICSLFSKEAAVMLPATLLATGLIFGSDSLSLRRRFTSTVRSIVPHILIGVVYLAFVVGHLHVMGLSVSTLLNPAEPPQSGDYVPVVSTGVFGNLRLALSWAFNIPQGWWAQWQDPRPFMLGYLRFFRLLVLALATGALMGAGRKLVSYGAAWFFITLLPTLPLVTHFLPYYLFLPVIGLSLVVGASFAWLYDRASRIHRAVAAAAVILILAGVLYVTSRSIRKDVADNRLLGGSSTVAFETLQDLKRFYPSLPEGSRLYFVDGDESLAWEHDSGGLIKMAYGLDDISVSYQSLGSTIPTDPSAIVLGVLSGRLTSKLIKIAKSSDLRMNLSANEVQTGDKYVLEIKTLRSVPVQFAYILNEEPIEFFTAQLDAGGRVEFEVSQQTRKGSYDFLAFNVAGNDEWIRTAQRLVVR